MKVASKPVHGKQRQGSSDSSPFLRSVDHQQAAGATALQRATHGPNGAVQHGDMLDIQRSLGNQATQNLLSERVYTPGSATGPMGIMRQGVATAPGSNNATPHPYTRNADGSVTGLNPLGKQVKLEQVDRVGVTSGKITTYWHTNGTRYLWNDKTSNYAPDAAAKISKEDVQYEVIAHRFAYHSPHPSAAKATLERWGYQGDWTGFVDDRATSFFVGLLMPKKDRPDLKPILAFRGTQEFLEGDLVADLDPVAVGYEQFQANKAHVAQLIATAGGEVDVTGHSLGGALAQHAAAAFPGSIRRVVTFQAPGISMAQAAAFKKAKKRPSVTHHIVDGDAVDKAGMGHLDGDTFKHYPEKNKLLGLGNHGSQLLSSPEFAQHHEELGLTSDAAWSEVGVDPGSKIKGKKPIQHSTEYPHPVKNFLAESGRTALGLALSPIAAVMSLGSATADMFREGNKDILDLAAKGPDAFKGMPKEKRSFMVYRLCQGRTGGKDELAILAILKASIAENDVADVIRQAKAAPIYYAVDGSNYDELRKIYVEHFYPKATAPELLELVRHCLGGLTERWEEMLSDILTTCNPADGRFIMQQLGNGNYNAGLRQVIKAVDGAEKRAISERYPYDAELRAAP